MRASSARTSSAFPLTAAPISGVAGCPVRAVACASAPRASSSFATSTLSTFAAAMSGVTPVASAALTSAPLGEQQAHDVGRAVGRCGHDQRCPAQLRHRIDVRAGVEQHPGLRQVCDRPVQRRHAGIARRFDIGAAGNQEPERFEAAKRRGEHQRRLPLRILGVDALVTHQRAQRRQIVLANGLVEPIGSGWRLADAAAERNVRMTAAVTRMALGDTDFSLGVTAGTRSNRDGSERSRHDPERNLRFY